MERDQFLPIDSEAELGRLAEERGGASPSLV